MTSSDPDCIFCRIVAGKMPCHKVLETDQVLSIMDIYPASEGHTLVMPKQHHETVFDITTSALQAVALAARSIAAANTKCLAGCITLSLCWRDMRSSS